MYEIFERLLQSPNVTAYQVSKATGISQSTLSDWKNGRSVPKMDKMQKIADYFSVTVDYLLGAEKEKDPAPAGKVSDEDIKFALFDGAPVTDAQYEEVKRFAKFIAEHNIRPKDD